MSRKSNSTKEVVEQFKKVHGDLYDYSKVCYVSLREKVTITCKIHGDFEQLSGAHRTGKGCPKCKGKSLSQEDIIEKFRSVHGDRYDYSLVSYKTGLQKQKIVCQEHGVFEQSSRNHALGHGCPECKLQNSRFSQDHYLGLVREVHGDKYDYSKLKYLGATEPIRIICKEHGEFTQSAGMHLSGQGCSRCAGVVRLTVSEFIKQCEEVHGTTYNYSLVKYTNTHTKVKIICAEHGVFEQLPLAHKRGQGCPICAFGGKTLTNEEFINKSIDTHGEKYSYENTKYTHNKTKVVIMCKTHGEFLQRPDQHLYGSGCPKCQPTESKGEVELSELISRYAPIERNDRTQIRGGLPLELDVFVPAKNLAFEFNGLYYHSDRYKDAMGRHKQKTDLCREKGIRLVHIFEDDWKYRRQVVEKFINNLLGVEQQRVFARKCSLSLIPTEEAKTFLNNNHIQGNTAGEINLALKSGEDVVAVMKLSSNTSKRGVKDDGVFELVRYATSCSVVGGASKLFKHFVKLYNPLRVRSFSDDSMFTGEMYPKLGFTNEGKVPPDYKVLVNGKRCHKASFKLSELKRKYPNEFDENLTEKENCHKLGLYRIYDAGKTRWIWDKHLTTPENVVL